MFNLEELVKVPNYEIQFNGEIHTYDPFVIGYELQAFEGEEHPEKLAEAVSKLLKFEVTPFEALSFLTDFNNFFKQHDDAIKKGLGRSLFLTTTMDLPPENSES